MITKITDEVIDRLVAGDVLIHKTIERGIEKISYCERLRINHAIVLINDITDIEIFLNRALEHGTLEWE